MSRTLRSVLNESNPNKISDALRSLPVGEALTLLPRAEVVSLVSGVAALSVPAIELISVWGRTTGAYATLIKPEGAPGAGEACADAMGNLAYNVADQVVEVVYLAAEGVIVTETIQVAASLGTLLGGKSAVKLLSATVLTGTVLGAKTVVARSTASALGQASLNDPSTGIVFNAGDVVAGTATVSYVSRPSTAVAAALAGATNL